MTDPVASVAPDAPVKPEPAPTHSFYFSQARASIMPATMSKSYWKGQQFTEVCKIRAQPQAAVGLVKLGDGVLSDVVVKPAAITRK